MRSKVSPHGNKLFGHLCVFFCFEIFNTVMLFIYYKIIVSMTNSKIYGHIKANLWQSYTSFMSEIRLNMQFKLPLYQNIVIKKILEATGGKFVYSLAKLTCICNNKPGGFLRSDAL